jgi:hypothetical protein
MNLTVQQIQIVSEEDGKSKLIKMRSAVKTAYDYVLFNEESLVRFSSDKAGPILPLVYLDILKEKFEDELPEGKFRFLYKLTSSSLQMVHVVNWEVINLSIILDDGLDSVLKRKGRVFATDDIKFPEFSSKATLIESLSQSEIEESPHQFKDKLDKKLAKRLKAGVLLGLLIAAAGYLTFSGDEKTELVEPKQKVVTVKKIRKDPFYEYKKSVEGSVLYGDIYDSLITAVLLTTKIPDGWTIDEVIYNQNIVQAQIKHEGGETTQLKYFRDSLQNNNGRFITIDGQSAVFHYPILEPDWFTWVDNKAPFIKTRDQLMDLLITLGGKMRSMQPSYHRNYTDQRLTFYFDEAPIIYLELFNYVFKDKPVFIDSVSVKPLKGDKTKANMEVTLWVKGV